MVNLNNSQINALTSFIYTKAAEAAKKRIDNKKILLRNTLNNSSFITAFKEFNEATKKAEKLRREAGKLLESARDNFRKKFPFDYLGDLNTLETAANSHV